MLYKIVKLLWITADSLLLEISTFCSKVKAGLFSGASSLKSSPDYCKQTAVQTSLPLIFLEEERQKTSFFEKIFTLTPAFSKDFQAQKQIIAYFKKQKKGPSLRANEKALIKNLVLEEGGYAYLQMLIQAL